MRRRFMTNPSRVRTVIPGIMPDAMPDCQQETAAPGAGSVPA
jgi:hypothetical protein